MDRSDLMSKESKYIHDISNHGTLKCKHLILNLLLLGLETILNMSIIIDPSRISYSNNYLADYLSKFDTFHDFGHFWKMSGAYPPHVRDMSGRRPGVVRKIRDSLKT